MKKMTWAALAAVLFAFAGLNGAAADDGPVGKWRGTISERGRDTLVELELRLDGALVAGSLAILGDAGPDVEKGTAFPIVQGERDGGKLSFVVAIVEGKIDNDALVFDLQWQGEKLEGTLHEKREGSPLIPVVFARWTEASEQEPAEKK